MTSRRLQGALALSRLTEEPTEGQALCSRPEEMRIVAPSPLGGFSLLVSALSPLDTAQALSSEFYTSHTRKEVVGPCSQRR